MISVSADKNSLFFPNISQTTWGYFCAQKAIENTEEKRITVALLESQSECEFLYSKLKYFLELGDANIEIKLLPDASQAGSDAARFDAVCERIGTLGSIHSQREKFSGLVVIATPSSIFESAPKPTSENSLEIKKGDIIALEKLKQQLSEFGYYNEVLCETPGQFAVRGGIVDIYPVSAAAPIRIDFFGDEVDSIRTFDPDTQLGDNKIFSARIDKIPESDASTTSKAIDYFEGIPTNWIFFEPQSLQTRTPELFLESEDSSIKLRGIGEIFRANNAKILGISSLEIRTTAFENSQLANFSAESISEYSNIVVNGIGVERFDAEKDTRDKLIKQLAKWHSEGLDIFVSSDGTGDEHLARRAFEDVGIDFICKFVKSGFGEGFIVRKFEGIRPNWKELSKNAKGAVFVGSRELFGRRQKDMPTPRRRMLSRKAQVDQLLDFSELCEGDYVVHLGNGICRYHGVSKIDVGGVEEDAIRLEFEDNAELFLPLHKSYLLSRYIGLDKKHPKLSRLDSKAWTKIKSAAEMAALDYASELLEMQSKREVSEGFAFPKDDQWQNDFEDAFPFTETPDQLRAAADVKADMQLAKPMDRLLCADVGFGKTEIAMRAAFKCAISGKQAAILCPTTILCQQHFLNFRQRFGGYPIVIEMLSRFRTAKEASKIKAQLIAGQIDILIGTHAMLSDDTQFKDLGLLVVDEEHRFGVRHKEKIKRIRTGVDVLSMSATPIPRTLYFAMMGARTMSIMETPPKDRFPVETAVKEYSPEIVKTAITQEISRGGQVFYLHNRVNTIEQTAEELRKMFPNLKIGVGHGQMSEVALERLMADFIAGKYDILVCTTIIESGLDIPNCNTIIIEGADKFGLAQLYQLRGRVGRFTRRAYAWLLLHKHATLVESARKRLGAIRQYNKPGAGFRIATRDLQLRGCGNLLGAKQSGHIAGVGFDLYCALLKRSISLLRGEKTSNVLRTRVELDFLHRGEGSAERIDVSQAENYFQEIRIREISKGGNKSISAYIPQDYIPQTQLRIDLYRRLSMAATKEELDKLLFETKDRFGAIPEPLKFCFFVERIRIIAEESNILAVETSGMELKILLPTQKTGSYFKLNGRFPLLTKSNPIAKLQEIEKFLTHTLPSIRK